MTNVHATVKSPTRLTIKTQIVLSPADPRAPRITPINPPTFISDQRAMLVAAVPGEVSGAAIRGCRYRWLSRMALT